VVLSISEGRQGAAVFFQRHHKASVLARECRHQVILPQKRSFANAGRIKRPSIQRICWLDVRMNSLRVQGGAFGGQTWRRMN